MLGKGIPTDAYINLPLKNCDRQDCCSPASGWRHFPWSNPPHSSNPRSASVPPLQGRTHGEEQAPVQQVQGYSVGGHHIRSVMRNNKEGSCGAHCQCPTDSLLAQTAGASPLTTQLELSLLTRHRRCLAAAESNPLSIPECRMKQDASVTTKMSICHARLSPTG